MKRVLAMTLLLLFCSACTAQPGGEAVTTTSAPSTAGDAAADKQLRLTGKALSQSFQEVKEGVTIDLPEVGMQKLRVIQKAQGRAADGKPAARSVYLLGDFSQEGAAIHHEAYLVVAENGKALFYDPEEESYEDLLYLRDVDGDGADEIILQLTVGSSGGAGSYSSRILRVEDGTLRELFNSIIIPEGETWRVVDTGFASEFLKGKKLKIKNIVTGYQTELDISGRYGADSFDESGEGTFNDSIHCDGFREFLPQDADGDGVFEIACKQYVSLRGHTDYIGDATSVLKYNAATQKMEVIQAGFEPFVENSLSSRESVCITPALFKILKDSIAQVKFSAEFQKGDSALYASYQKNFLRLLRGEVPLFDGASQQEIYLDEFLRLGGRKIEAMPQISYYFFDMDLAPDAGPELCIVEDDGVFTHIVKYEPVTDHFVLWMDMISDTILGSREVYYYSPNARAVFAYQKLNQSGKAECTVRFYGEGYIEDIYAVALPDYADKSKNTVLSDAMKQQTFYDDAYGNFFRVTEKQWEELRKELYGVEKLAEERIREVSYTFAELFGDLS